MKGDKDYSIYQFYGEPNNLFPQYIGQSVDFHKRYEQHRRDSIFFDNYHVYTVTRVSSKQEMDDMEKRLIKRHTPDYNRNFNASNCLFQNKGKKKQSEPLFNQRITFYDAKYNETATIDVQDSNLFFTIAKRYPEWWQHWRGIRIERVCDDFGQIEPRGIHPELLEEYESLVNLRKVNAYEYHQVMKSMKPKRQNNS